MGLAGRSLHNAYNVNRFRGDLLDGRFDGMNPSFGTIAMVTSTSASDYHGGTVALERNFQQGVLLQGAYTFGRAMDDADAAVGIDRVSGCRRNQGGPRGGRVRRGPQALGGRAVGGAVLQGCVDHGWKAARWLAVGGLGDSPERVADQRRPQRNYPGGDFNADGNSGDRPNAPAAGVKQGGWSQAEDPAGIFLASDFPRPAPGENGNLARNAFRGPGYVDVSLSLSKKFRVQRWSGEFRLDAFNALNRVNLADPNMDLSNTNFGRVTSQLAPARSR